MQLLESRFVLALIKNLCTSASSSASSAAARAAAAWRWASGVRLALEVAMSSSSLGRRIDRVKVSSSLGSLVWSVVGCCSVNNSTYCRVCRWFVASVIGICRWASGVRAALAVASRHSSLG